MQKPEGVSSDFEKAVQQRLKRPRQMGGCCGGSLPERPPLQMLLPTNAVVLQERDEAKGRPQVVAIPNGGSIKIGRH